jgi:hypothetical protein
MKQIIKMAFLEGITIKEARERFNAISRTATRRGNHGSTKPITLRKSLPSKSRSRYCSKK